MWKVPWRFSEREKLFGDLKVAERFLSAGSPTVRTHLAVQFRENFCPSCSARAGWSEEEFARKVLKRWVVTDRAGAEGSAQKVVSVPGLMILNGPELMVATGPELMVFGVKLMR